MKTIDTLISDIYSFVGNPPTEEGYGRFIDAVPADIGIRLAAQFAPKVHKPSLRLSQMGPRCPKALWHSIHTPERAEAMPPWTQVKFTFGTILEALSITLAKAAGHTVSGEQDEVVVDGIIGHRDCVIDGCVVDVKSAASRSFEKFKNKTISQDDSFGYLEQLDGYVVGSLQDPLVTIKDKGYLLVIDKQLGHMVLYEHYIREDHIRARIRDYKRIIESPNPPECMCGLEKAGESGNIKLNVRASYSQFKHVCFPNLRTFLFAGGPVYYTKVVRRPAAHVPELKNGVLSYV